MTNSHIADGHDGSTGSGFLPGTAYAVLGLLSFGAELSGYELRQLARNSLRFFYWSPAQSQIYRELRRLAGLGYVTGRTVNQQRRPDKIAYSITEAGRSELTRWLEQAPVAPPAIRYDAALRLFFGHLTTRDRLLGLVAEHRAHLERMVAELHAVQEMLTVDPSLRLAQIIADWGDHLYTHELEALDHVSAALAQLTPPSGRVTVPPGTVQPLPAAGEPPPAARERPSAPRERLLAAPGARARQAHRPAALGDWLPRAGALTGQRSLGEQDGQAGSPACSERERLRPAVDLGAAVLGHGLDGRPGKRVVGGEEPAQRLRLGEPAVEEQRESPVQALQDVVAL